jgi:hypothetical protein
MQVHSAATLAAVHSTASSTSQTPPLPITGVPFSDKVSGKTYSTHVLPMTSGYEAAVPNLPGAAAEGATVESVENRIAHLISFFV